MTSEDRLREAYRDAALEHIFSAFDKSNHVPMYFAAVIRHERAALAATEAPAATGTGLHPDDGHDHWFACVRCGVDNGINEAATSPPPAPLDAEAIAARHHLDEPYTDLDGTKVEATWCVADNQMWPCDAVQLLAALSTLAPATPDEPHA